MGILPRAILLRSWIHAADFAKNGTWYSPKGPCAVAALSLKDAGWDIDPVNPFIWRDRCNKPHKVLDIPPRQVQKMVSDDLQTELWLNMASAKTVYHNLEGRPWLDPIRRLLNSKKQQASWGPKEKGMLRCLAANGFWTLERLRQCGYETDGLCKFCQKPLTVFHLL